MAIQRLTMQDVLSLLLGAGMNSRAMDFAAEIFEASGIGPEASIKDSASYP